jgi:hypothetical protein
MHLFETMPPEVLDATMPNAFGMKWGPAFGTATVVLQHGQLYARQLESLVVARWEGASDYSMLQPAAPYPLFAMGVFTMEQARITGKKQMTLIGESASARSAASSTTRDLFEDNDNNTGDST